LGAKAKMAKVPAGASPRYVAQFHFVCPPQQCFDDQRPDFVGVDDWAVGNQTLRVCLGEPLGVDRIESD
jgi:hypothetical protein